MSYPGRWASGPRLPYPLTLATTSLGFTSSRSDGSSRYFSKR